MPDRGVVMHGYRVGSKRNNMIMNDRVSKKCGGLFIRGYGVSDPGLRHIVHVGAGGYHNNIVRGVCIHGMRMNRYHRTILGVGLRCRGHRGYSEGFPPMMHRMCLSGIADRGDGCKILVAKCSSHIGVRSVRMAGDHFGGMRGGKGLVAKTGSMMLGRLCVGKGGMEGWSGGSLMW